MTERQRILEATKGAKPGSEAHSLRAQAENGLLRFDYCAKCLQLVHASLQCQCGRPAVSVSPEKAPVRGDKMKGFFIQRGVESL